MQAYEMVAFFSFFFQFFFHSSLFLVFFSLEFHFYITLHYISIDLSIDQHQPSVNERIKLRI